MSQDVLSYLALYSVPEVGTQRIISLVRKFGSAKEALGASLKELTRVEDIGDKIAHNIKHQVNWKLAQEQFSLAEKKKFKILTFFDEEYPKSLKNIYDPPPLIFFRGEIRSEDQKAIAVVGSRKASSYGRMVTESLVEELASRGITIVSGLARGIDSISHQAALKAGGRTLAVLGSGLDIIYPPENRKLADGIAENGAVISEFFLGTKPEATNFPQRNRVISGLCLGIVIVEAGPKSGALLTARHALEQNREVFAVPGDIRSQGSKGTNELIKQGAKLVSSVEDILVELNELTNASAKKERIERVEQDLPKEEKDIFKLLSIEPYHIDKISKELGLRSSEALSFLLSLELKGLVKQLPGKVFARA
ncbi:MAG TPA: DNA-processing protein DprA [candidate division Zixibacteria bacterium]